MGADATVRDTAAYSIVRAGVAGQYVKSCTKDWPGTCSTDRCLYARLQSSVSTTRLARGQQRDRSSGLTKSFGGHKAVDNLSFTVQPGVVTGFLGPNGAGKSTTMRLMIDLDHGGGTTTFDGKKFRELPRPMKTVGVLLEAKAFHPPAPPATTCACCAAPTPSRTSGSTRCSSWSA